MSPSARAPRSASVIECVRASASECPSAPTSDSISMPPRISLRPGTSLWMSEPKPILYITFHKRFCQNQVFRVRYLDVPRTSLNDGDGVAELFDQVTLVSDRVVQVGVLKRF